MIDKLLALAAVEHRQRLQNPEPVEISGLVRAAGEQCTSRLARSGLRLLVDVPDGLPRLRGDAFRLRQALVNLVENAADFSSAGSDITLRVRQDASSVRFEVVDHGAGVPDYALPRVFERFYSLPRPGGDRSSGLGLCFVAEVAALYCGRHAGQLQGGGNAAFAAGLRDPDFTHASSSPHRGRTGLLHPVVVVTTGEGRVCCSRCFWCSRPW
jgi:two-component system sensor histidine kinase CreC